MELVGRGCGPMDLCTFLCIRSDNGWRRKYEKEMVELYYETLVSYGEKFGTLTRESYTLERCWHDYKFEGASRLCFYMPQNSVGFNKHVVLQMQDSFSGFFEDHGITAENIPPLIW